MHVLEKLNLQPVVLAAFENLVGPNDSTEVWHDDELSSIVEEFIRVFEFENFFSIASDAPTVIKERKQAITDEFYDEYVQRVFGIGDGEDEPRSRSLIGEGIVAPAEATVRRMILVFDDDRPVGIHLSADNIGGGRRILKHEDDCHVRSTDTGNRRAGVQLELQRFHQSNCSLHTSLFYRYLKPAV